MRTESRTPRPAVVDPSIHLGPALDELSPDDDDGVRELFAEQRARLEVVRRDELWGFLGGIRGQGEHRWIYAQLASIPAMALALLVAGFTRGPVLWGCGAVALGLLAVGSIARRRARGRWISIYRRGVIRPATVIAFDPGLTSDSVTPRLVHALVGPDVEDAAGLRRLMEAGERLRALVEGRADAPRELAAFVEQARKVCADARQRGPRIEAPAALSAGRAELVGIGVNPEDLPEERLTSHLLFTIADPVDRDPHRALQVPVTMWGTSAVNLCSHFPLEVAP